MMNTQVFKKANKVKREKLKKKFTGLMIVAVIIIIALSAIGILAGDSEGFLQRSAILEENHMLKQRVSELETEAAALQTRISELESYIAQPPEQTETTDQTDGLNYQNGMYYYNEETPTEKPDSPRNFYR